MNSVGENRIKLTAETSKSNDLIPIPVDDSRSNTIVMNSDHYNFNNECKECSEGIMSEKQDFSMLKDVFYLCCLCRSYFESRLAWATHKLQCWQRSGSKRPPKFELVLFSKPKLVIKKLQIQEKKLESNSTDPTLEDPASITEENNNDTQLASSVTVDTLLACSMSTDSKKQSKKTDLEMKNENLMRSKSQSAKTEEHAVCNKMAKELVSHSNIEPGKMEVDLSGCQNSVQCATIKLPKRKRVITTQNTAQNKKQITIEMIPEGFPVMDEKVENFLKKEAFPEYIRPQCSICNNTFSTPGSLKRHMRGHTNERPFACSFCPQSFLRQENLRSHVYNIHNVEAYFKCTACDMDFCDNKSLTKHRKTHVESDKSRKGYISWSSLPYYKNTSYRKKSQLDEP